MEEFMTPSQPNTTLNFQGVPVIWDDTLPKEGSFYVTKPEAQMDEGQKNLIKAFRKAGIRFVTTEELTRD